MIRVTVEIVPHGDESRARVIDTVCIANVGPPPGELPGSDKRRYIASTDARSFRARNFRDPIAAAVLHRRRDGVRALIAKVFAELPPPAAGTDGGA